MLHLIVIYKENQDKCDSSDFVSKKLTKKMIVHNQKH